MLLHSTPTHRSVTLVWLDADDAILLRWRRGGANTDGANPARAGGAGGPGPTIERLSSGVPAHRRATGGVRHNPTFRSGGGAEPDDLVERRRQRLLEQYLRAIAERLPPDDRLVLVGPGQLHERLAAEVRIADARHGRDRPVEVASSAPRTERQLVAWLRDLAGAPPERRRATSAVPPPDCRHVARERDRHDAAIPPRIRVARRPAAAGSGSRRRPGTDGAVPWAVLTPIRNLRLSRAGRASPTVGATRAL